LTIQVCQHTAVEYLTAVSLVVIKEKVCVEPIVTSFSVSQSVYSRLFWRKYIL
jgi:hypothetical protein